MSLVHGIGKEAEFPDAQHSVQPILRRGFVSQDRLLGIDRKPFSGCHGAALPVRSVPNTRSIMQSKSCAAFLNPPSLSSLISGVSLSPCHETESSLSRLGSCSACFSHPWNPRWSPPPCRPSSVNWADWNITRGSSRRTCWLRPPLFRFMENSPIFTEGGNSISLQ